jgi:undecaprenyl-diphosphatase
MTVLQAMLTAIFQGVTELFPVSSLGHTVILPALLDWDIDQQSPRFLPFLVVLHLGTAAALLVYFRREWLDLLMGAFGGGSEAQVITERHLLILLVLGTLPAVVMGLVFEKALRHSSPPDRAGSAYIEDTSARTG